MPDGCIPVDVVEIVKAIDDDGRSTIFIRSSNLEWWEIVAMLQPATIMANYELQKAMDND